jgi:hypothetical protein
LIDPSAREGRLVLRAARAAGDPPFPTPSPSRTDPSDFDTLIGDADGIDNPVSDKV